MERLNGNTQRVIWILIMKEEINLNEVIDVLEDLVGKNANEIFDCEENKQRYQSSELLLKIKNARGLLFKCKKFRHHA